MSSTIKYKGATIATADNNTKTLQTSGKYLEGDIEVTDVSSGASIGTKIITANGQYDASDDGYDGYSEIDVNVPNTYSASDEGKVVSNGALVAQTSTAFTENGTYDTTTNDEVVVNVSGGGGSLQDFLTLAINYQLDSEGEDIVLTKSGTAGVVDMNSLLRNANLKKVTVNNITQLAPWFFGGSTITEVVFDDKYVNFSESIFRGCTSLVKAILPSVAKTYINYANAQYEFDGCTNLSVLHCPNLEGGQSGMFRGCSSLPYFDAITSPIATNMFYGCSALNVLILRKSDSIATLSNVNAFTNTPFASGGTGGTLYVPSALISSYQSATNWSTILGYANNSIQAIEGSQYENYYADGTPIAA